MYAGARLTDLTTPGNVKATNEVRVRTSGVDHTRRTYIELVTCNNTPFDTTQYKCSLHFTYLLNTYKSGAVKEDGVTTDNVLVRRSITCTYTKPAVIQASMKNK